MTITPTPEQVAVISAPLGPIRVAAGAGTGKTTTVALRVVSLVADLGLEPERILGITFTNKAAAELSDRIRVLLSPHVESGREVEVHTYHGFAAQLLREFGALVGVERSSKVITPTFSRQLLRSVLHRVPLASINISDPNNIEHMRRLASQLGDHLLLPEDVALPDEPADEPWQFRSDLVVALRHYQAEKTRLGLTDYADLIVLAHRLVARHPEVATELRQRYQAVMLDEYQDTNPAQRELLRALFGNGFPVMAVGDIDQTIYEWRGASPFNFEQFPSHFRHLDGADASTVNLTANRRSLPNIVEVANAIRAQTGSGQPPLAALADRTGGEVVVAWHANAVVEAEWIARNVAELASSRRWKDMAVLFRKNKDMILVHDALRAADIPVEVANLGGLLGVPEVADLHAWLRILQTPEDAPALYRIVMGSRFRLGIGDLAHLARWVSTRERNDRATLALENPGSPPDRTEHDQAPARSMLEAIDHLDEMPGLRIGARHGLERFASEYRRLLEAAQGVSLVELCRRILDLTGAWTDLAALSDSEQLTARLNLYRFLDLAEDWSPLEGRPSLAAFNDYLALMSEDQNEELDTARLSGEDAVTLLTVHRAKGLEWDIVFVPACYEKNFPTQSQGFDNPYGPTKTAGKYLPYEFRLDRQWLPPLHSGIDKRTADDLLRAVHVRQEWRIAYVAATRARERLFVSGAWWYGHPEPKAKASRPSELWALVAGHACASVESEPGDEPLPPLLLRFEPDAPAPDPLFPGGWDAALRQELASPGWAMQEAAAMGLADGFAAHDAAVQQMLFDLPAPSPATKDSLVSTSVTGLVTYAHCPQRFFWSEVERLPRRPNPAARAGTRVHRQIELHQRGEIPLDDFGPELYDGEGSGRTQPGSEAIEAAGTATAGPFQMFAASRFARARARMIEAPFEMILPGVRLRGRIDAVFEPEPGHWEIVDFKSGRPHNEPSGHVQLEAYALAAETGALGPPPDRMTVTFAFLGGGLTERSEPVDGEWLSSARSHLTGLAEGISHSSFDPRPGAGCHGCDFLRFCDTGRAHVAASG
jgi:DNA helicase-2/ATP-dependent DNA helicase PcrA